MGRLVCEVIPYRGFKEKIRITKELQNCNRYFEIHDNIIIAY